MGWAITGVSRTGHLSVLIIACIDVFSLFFSFLVCGVLLIHSLMGSLQVVHMPMHYRLGVACLCFFYWSIISTEAKVVIRIIYLGSQVHLTGHGSSLNREFVLFDFCFFVLLSAVSLSQPTRMDTKDRFVGSFGDDKRFKHCPEV